MCKDIADEILKYQHNIINVSMNNENFAIAFTIGFRTFFYNCNLNNEHTFTIDGKL